MFYVAAVDAFYVCKRLLNYATLTDIYERTSVRANAIGSVVEVVDGFLLAIVLLMFAGGIVLISGSLFLTEFTTKTEKWIDPQRLERRANDCKACKNGTQKDCEVCRSQS